MKTKYLLLSDGKSPHTLKWVKELIKYFDIYLISFNGISEELELSLKKENIFILNKEVSTKGNNLKILTLLFKVNAIIKEINPRYVNAHYITSYGFISSLIKKFLNKKVYLIESSWGSDILVSPNKNFIYKFITSFALNQANLITSDSYFMSDKIENLLSTKKEVLSFPFGLKKENKSVKSKNENLIFSNRALSVNYRILDIINWFANLKNKNLKLVIANEGVDKTSLFELVNKLNIKNRVTFVGFLSQKEQKNYYLEAKYYISIPESDSTAVSLLEAMYYGCIPIISNLPANREWIIDSLNGIFFDKDLALDNINVSENIIEINKSLIENKAIFIDSIKILVNKLNKKINNYE